MEKIPALTPYQQALNSYNPDAYSAHKRITAEEWNALLLSGFAQGNRQEEYLDEIINGHLSEVIDTINEVIDSYDDHELRLAIQETHSEESDLRIAAAEARLTTLETDTLQQLYAAIETKTNVQSDWEEKSIASDAYIRNKPNPLMTSNFTVDENGVITLTFTKYNGDYERHIYDTNLEKIVANLDFVTVDGITYLRLTREDGSFIDLPLSELADYITTITKTSSEGLVDTYTITLRSGTTFTFDVTNGSDIEDITVSGDVFTFTLTNGVVKTVTVGTDAVLADSLLAGDVPYDNTNSGLASTDVQAAIDELSEDLNANSAAIDELSEEKQNRLTFDSEPMSGSTNPVISSGIHSALATKAANTHVHGNISNDGKIGSEAGKIITTGTGGALQASPKSNIKISDLTDDTNTAPVAKATAAGKVINSLTFGSKTFDGSAAKTITADDVGAMFARVFTNTGPTQNLKSLCQSYGAYDSMGNRRIYIKCTVSYSATTPKIGLAEIYGGYFTRWVRQTDGTIVNTPSQGEWPMEAGDVYQVVYYGPAMGITGKFCDAINLQAAFTSNADLAYVEGSFEVFI